MQRTNLCRISRVVALFLSLQLFFCLPQSYAEDYRTYAHRLGDLTQHEKGSGYFGASTAGALGIAAIITSGLTLGIGAIGILLASGSGLGAYKYYRYCKAKPFYAMARIMAYVKGQGSEADQVKYEREFSDFYQTLHRSGAWSGSKDEFKSYLEEMSSSGRLENHPNKEQITLYLHYQVASWQQQHGYVNDPFKIIAAFKGQKLLGKKMTPTPQLFAKIDLVLMAYQRFSPLAAMGKHFSSVEQLFELLAEKGFFATTLVSLDTEEILSLYQDFYPAKLNLALLSEDKLQLLNFEIAVHKYISQKIAPRSSAHESALAYLLHNSGGEKEGISNEPRECPICREALIGSTARCSTCKNDSCLTCIEHHIRVSSTASCPYCRTAFGKNQENLRITVIPLPYMLNELVGKLLL
jgi:hypothetical protein